MLCSALGAQAGCGGDAVSSNGTSSAAVEACSLPAGYQVEQYGEVADGTRVLVILPIGAIATGYRLFYGPPSRVAEYPVSNTGFTSINRAWYFYVGELSYGVVFSSGVTESPSRLVIDHGAGQIESRMMSLPAKTAAEKAAAAVSLFCLTPG